MFGMRQALHVDDLAERTQQIGIMQQMLIGGGRQNKKTAILNFLPIKFTLEFVPDEIN